ncbi:MAG: ATP-binding protein [Candidatus Omnitrophica bacterium]|nr:ATP-binding protein [Candidatus Omnitrophota bacterium]
MRKRSLKKGLNIRGKAVVVICMSIFTVMLMTIALTYFVGLRMMRSLLSEEHGKYATLLTSALDRIIKAEINDLKVYVKNPVWINKVEEANNRYSKMSPEEVRTHLAAMDKRWIAASDDDPLVKEYLESDASMRMKVICDSDPRIGEIFITDKYGGLVAASGKTEDFYQSDEAWWQEAFDGGAGKTVVTDISRDESSGTLGISLVLPMKDSNGELIGIAKEVLDIKNLFSPLETFEIGKTGHAVLINEQGYIIFHKDLVPLTVKYLKKGDIKDLLGKKSGWGIVSEHGVHKQKTFVVFRPYIPPFFLNSGTKWYLLIDQDVVEVFAPLNIFILPAIMIVLIAMLVMIPVGFVFGNLLVAPIKKLKKATEKIIAGYEDYKIDIKTGDEIEEFAESFKEMLSRLKAKQNELIKAKDEIEDLSKSLEKKVEDRTAELETQSWGLTKANEGIKVLYKELEERNEQLKRLDQLKSDFVSTVSHELRTPLSIMKEGVSLVLDKITGSINENQEKTLGMVQSNIDRLATIINDLLDISKIEAGKMEVKKSLTDICYLVKDACAKWRLQSDKKKQELTCVAPDGLVNVYLDADKVVQILNNLISNAIKYTPDNGKIKVELINKKDEIEISVSDNGIGISREDHPRVFSKFQQFARPPSAGSKGTGLGLAIARELVQMHQGTIWLESEVNKGSRFVFTLPKMDSETVFKEHISTGIKEVSTRGAPLSLITLKVTGFSQIQKEMGFEKSHNMLKEIEAMINGSLRRKADTVVRDTGEIIVVLLDTSKTNAEVVRSRIEKVIQKYLIDSRKKLPGEIYFTMGFASYPDEAKSDEELLNKARGVIRIRTDNNE